MKSDLVRRVARGILGRTFYRVGRVATIRVGPARGLCYRIFADYGLGPIFGRWEPAAQRWLVELVQPGMVAYDIGANYGIHTLLLARRAGDSGRVYAFEPDAEIGAALREAVQLNRFANVQIIPAAVAEASGSALFQRGAHAGAGHLSDQDAGRTTRVETIALDDIAIGKILAAHGYSAVRSDTRERIARLDRGWPAPDGVWGQIVATKT